MKNIKFIIFLSLFAFTDVAFAHIGPERQKQITEELTLTLREECQQPNSPGVDQQINNVRARLLTGGDVWWDLDEGKYVVPKTIPGQQDVSSIFAGAVWLGGLDPAGNLKIAAVDYRSGGNTDFYSGPIDPLTGATDLEICEDWDQHFTVLATNVEEHNINWEQNRPIDSDEIPEDVKYWPGKGNPYWLEKFDFELPSTGQGLASFWDEDGDGDYDPAKGDFPVIDIRGCFASNRKEAKELVPDEMIFWIYNDAGGAHTLTQGTPILMEIQVQAFAFASNDQINDMTFQRYKLINRASSDIRDTYFGMWMDPDLGCFTDDYIGCDVERSFAYVYNEDALDGTNGTTCDLGVATYQDEVPALGLDYFRGPLAPYIFASPDTTQTIEHTLTSADLFFPPYKVGDVVTARPADIGENSDFSLELGMSSFIYYNNQSIGSPDPATTDPGIDVEYYNYLQGLWRDGSAMTFGGDGFNPGSVDSVKYAFPDPPDKINAWSMCEESLPFGDRRTLQASGPFLLKPQAINELIVGIVWVPDLEYPCPDMSRVFFADDLAQGLFDNCFEIKDGPDAPDVDVIELNREIILVLTNDTLRSNNAFELYEESDLKPVPPGEDNTYNFEGYQIYQLKDNQVSAQQLNDVTKARLVQQVDIKNGTTSLFNWQPALVDPLPINPEIVWTFEQKVEAANEGVRHTFRMTNDAFASGDTRLINHREYYYMALAYGANEFQEFEPSTGLGQSAPYCAGRRNIKVTTAVPRPIVYQNQNANYGDGVAITRIDGVGAGGVFLDITDDMYDKILDGTAAGEITYKEGAGPVDIKIYNPMEVSDGNFRLSLVGEFLDGRDCEIAPGARWVLEDLSNGNIIASEQSIDQINEQILNDYGFAITMGQTEDTGDQASPSNGVIGSRIEYDDLSALNWLLMIPDDGRPIYNYLRTDTQEPDQNLDPEQAFSNEIGDAAFAPFILTDFRNDALSVSPGWKDFEGGEDLRGLTKIEDLNNVDIVFTSDKSKWSRCVIVETSNQQFRQAGFFAEGDVDQFDLRAAPSVGKEDNDGDGRPDPDGDGVGMGWFPGYAVDVETGKRLNIFFGENSTYNQDFVTQIDGGNPIGADMMFNPNGQEFAAPLPGLGNSIWNAIAGGQHYIYVTRQEYNECEDLRARLDPRFVFTFKRDALKLVTWAGTPLSFPNEDGSSSMLSYADGLIPSDVTVKLRVDNPYSLEESFGLSSNNRRCDEVGGLPVYEFSINNKAPGELDDAGLETALSNVNVVPNPYFAFSEYETSRLNTIVKITNLPARANVTIYSLDGKFIRQFRRDERGASQSNRANPGINSTQVFPSVEWDLKNSKGIPIASGVYLIHVKDQDSGLERTIKWFGVNRKFDPAGL